MTNEPIKRLMPSPIDMGRNANLCIGEILRMEDIDRFTATGPTVMGFVIPPWQRPVVWDQSRQIKWIESAWLGLDLGSYAFNRVYDAAHYDGYLIDGLQRMTALQNYIADQFPVFGYRWSEVTVYDRRRFENTIFRAQITESGDEKYLRDYYNRMNFGGVAHTPDQMA